MYCEYYKLHKIIIDYVIENVTDKKILELIKLNNNFPIYKDLEPFKQYDFLTIQQIHELNISILHSLCSFLISKEHDLKNYQNKNNTGLNIDNFVSTFNFNNTVMKEKVALFVTYIEFFHKLHTKYLKRFTTKIQLLISQLNYDIKFEENEKPEVAKKNALDTLKNEIKDKTLLKSLKSNMSDNDDISVTSEIYNKNKTNSDDSLTNSSDRSGSDASDKPYLTDSGSENNDNNLDVNNNKNKIDENFIELKSVKREITSPKVQFNNVKADTKNKSNPKNEQLKNNTKEDKLKGIIKIPSNENTNTNKLDELLEDVSTLEKQTINDECLSAITTDSKDNDNSEAKFKKPINPINLIKELLEPDHVNEYQSEKNNKKDNSDIITIKFQEQEQEQESIFNLIDLANKNIYELMPPKDDNDNDSKSNQKSEDISNVVL
jgi:hypothetical protein